MSNEGLILSYRGQDIQVPLAPDESVKSLSPEEREEVKAAIAGGREYFLADVTGVGASGVMSLLKAFSLFKKRQLSNMKLVLTGAGAIDKLDSYKYRDDICLYAERTREQLEGAYAVIHMRQGNDPGIGVLNAWRARAPVIVVGGGRTDDAVLQVSGDMGALAEALKSLYKDEGFRNQLIGKGALRVAGLSIGQSVAAIGGLLGKEMGSNREN